MTAGPTHDDAAELIPIAEERDQALDVPGFTTPVTEPGPNQEHSLYQRREKIFTRAITGRFQRLRALTGWPLLIGYFVTPWLRWDDRQAVLFDLPMRQFHVLGMTFWPQDFWLLGWLLMLAAFTLFAMTTVIGRLWCGYTCPQTVWTAIFMWAEQVAEGSRHQRIRLDAASWSLTKIRKRGLKYALWGGVAIATGFTFVAYFAPARELLPAALTWQLGGWATFWIAFFALATFINAGWLREQVCLYMCPYARFQSAMIDENTLTVSYDAARGEPRGKRQRATSARRAARRAPSAKLPVAGSCVDCQLCVQVCPTGIDIRDGLQYECIGCAHCIDACDEIMRKMGDDPGLIRYASANTLAGARLHWWRPRSVGYALVCAVLTVGFLVAVTQRSPFTASLLRDRTQLFVTTHDGGVRNEFQLKLVNKQQRPALFHARLLTPDSLTTAGGERIEVDTAGTVDVPFSIIVKPDQLGRVSQPGGRPAILEVCDRISGACLQESTRLFVPTPATGTALRRST